MTTEEGNRERIKRPIRPVLRSPSRLTLVRGEDRVSPPLLTPPPGDRPAITFRHSLHRNNHKSSLRAVPVTSTPLPPPPPLPARPVTLSR